MEIIRTRERDRQEIYFSPTRNTTEFVQMAFNIEDGQIIRYESRYIHPKNLALPNHSEEKESLIKDLLAEFKEKLKPIKETKII